jgi:amino acid adenylation domain-containing protein
VERGATAPVSIGRPIANTQVYILDAQLEPVPLGASGELFVAGEGLARGYLQRPGLTAEKFLPNPFSATPGARMYRTGDLARQREDGQIEYLGRLDHQVKLRGFRIELGEIEAALQTVASEATVLMREDGAGDKRLVAYLVAHPGQALPDEAQLRAMLAQKLPEYMLPSYFVGLQRMPLTPNGKLDRRALPAPDTTRSQAGYVAPRSAEQQRMAAIWADILKLDKVGLYDDFFELGGHSLLATQLATRIASAFQVNLPLRAIFDAPQLAELVERVQSASNAKACEAAATEPAEAFPLSFAQQRLWFLDQFEGNSPAYNIPVALRLRGKLRHAALERALHDVLHRHDALRACFENVDGVPVQRIRPQLDWSLAQHDLRNLPPDEAQARARALALEEARTPFKLQTGPLIRGRLLQLGQEEQVLLLTMHHIVSDGWSMGVLLREVAALYAAHALGMPPKLPELPLRYVDFASRQRERVSGELLAQQLGYWKQRLDGSPALLTLPTDRPRPPVQSQRGATLQYAIPAELAARLQALSRQHHCSLFMTLCAAFNVLLARYAGQDDICIGTPIANRHQEETEGLIGLFVNTLVLRTQVDMGASFIELLKQVRTHTLDAYAHQDAPFEQLIEVMQSERHPSYSPLFQVMLVLQNAPMGALSLAGLELELLPHESSTAKFDLTLTLNESAAGLQGDIEYSTDLFDASTVERMAQHFTALLQAVVADPQSAVGELPILGAAERQQLLAGFNDTARRYPQLRPGFCTLQQLFEAQALASAEHTAVIYEGQAWTYAQLNARANQLARHLRGLGVGPDSLVGLCAERSLEMIVGLYGILKAGGAYVPLEPSYPPERLATIADDAKLAVVLTQQHVRERLAKLTGVPIFVLDEEAAVLAQYPADNLEHMVQPQHLAYVIYTSGSTGKPKGVGIDHQGIVNRLQWMQEAYRLDKTDRVLQKTPYSFDVSVWEFFWPLLEGATLVVARPGGHQDVAYLADLIDAQGITTVHFVPPMLEVFLNEAGECGRSLRQVMCSGQALPPELQQRFFAKWQHVALHNLYGPTEASVDVTAWECRPDSTLSSVPIGKPIANIQIHLLDDALNPVPVGVTGHLYIAGIGLARGYVNRPELTAQAFVPNPFSAAPGARMYKSGDLARYLPDGTIEYLGRSDHQVKLRGLRIELGEIEASLAALEAVRDVLVLACTDERKLTRLVAYLVPHAGQVLPDAGSLRATLKQTLPDYMVPEHFVTLDAMPLTANGKIDRKALPVPDMAPSDSAYVAPRTYAERMVAEIWADVLGVERVGLSDDFFALGGQSLLATQMVSRIKRVLGIDLPLRALFEAPTIASLMPRLGPAGGGEALPPRHPNLVPIRPDGELLPLFLIHPIGGEVQYAFDLAAHLDRERPIYALAASGMASEETPCACIREMAATYVQAIRQVQARGPYNLAGWSLGGMIAYEMAHQLLGAGEAVQFVGMIDTGSAPRHRALARARHGMAIDEGRALLHWVSDLHPEVADARQHAVYGELMALAERQDIEQMIAVCQRAALLPAQLDSALVRRMLAVYRAGAQAAEAYETPVAKLRVTFFAADRQEGEDPSLGWSELLGERLELARIGGSHWSIVRPPQLEKLAREIARRIRTHSPSGELSLA